MSQIKYKDGDWILYNGNINPFRVLGIICSNGKIINVIFATTDKWNSGKVPITKDEIVNYNINPSYFGIPAFRADYINVTLYQHKCVQCK